MPTQTKPRRTSSATRGRFARNAATSRGQGLHRRRPPKPTGIKKLLTGLTPGAAAKKAAPSSKKGAAGGIALAAAAGVILKNRNKLAQMRSKDTGASHATGGTVVPPVTSDVNRSPAP